jgi:hypothetical protein
MRIRLLSVLALAGWVLLPATPLSASQPLPIFTSKALAMQTARNAVPGKLVMLVAGQSGCNDCVSFENITLFDSQVYPIVTNALVYWYSDVRSSSDYMTYASISDPPLPVVAVIDPANPNHSLLTWYGGGGAAATKSLLGQLLVQVSKPEIANVTATATDIAVQGTNKWISLNAWIGAVAYRIGDGPWSQRSCTNGIWSAPFAKPGSNFITFSVCFLMSVTPSSVFHSISQTNTVALSVLTPQTITFDNPGPHSFCEQSVTLGATADSGLPVSYTLLSGPATLNTNSGVLAFTGAGTITVMASQNGNSTYAAATPVTNSFTVTAVGLTVSGAAANNKVYDGGTVATLNFSGASLVGLCNWDSSTTLNTSGAAGQFADQNIGTNKTVTVSGLALSGTNAAGYTLTQPGLTANITPAPLNVSASGTLVYGQDPANAVYTAVYYPLQGTDTTSVVTGSADFHTDATATNYINSYVGTNYTVFVDDTGTLSSPNYTFAVGTNGFLTITPAALTVTHVTASDKVYDGTTGATLNLDGAGLDGLVNGDDASVSLNTNNAAGTFDNKNVGVNKTVYVTGLVTVGALGTNYSLVQPTTIASIAKAPLTVTATGVDKTYDCTTAATVTFSDNRVAGDVLTNSGWASFSDKNVGTGKTVTVTSININGTDAGNYTVADDTTNTTASINPRSLAVTANNFSRAYGAANPTFTGVISGLQSCDYITATYACSATNNSPVGSQYSIIPTIVDTNNYLANYTATTTNGTLTVVMAIDTLAPRLVITSHADLQEVTTNRVTLSGTASDAGLGDSGIKSVTVNGLPAANGTANSNNVANWSRVVNLSPGTNTIKVVATDNAPAHNSTSNVVHVISDMVRPTCLVTSPFLNQRWSNAVITVKGRAQDNLQVAGVWCQTNGFWSYASPSNGTWANWTVDVALVPGLNMVRAYAVDAAGNRSLTNTVSFTYVATDRLTLVTTGKGTLSPNYSNALLEVGKTYTITATPGSGYVLSNWTGTVLGVPVVSSNTSRLSFVMRSNLVLEADFIPNPFIALKGSYNGLFYPTINQQPAPYGATNSGFFALALASNGGFSGRVGLQGTSLPFTGRFNAQLQAQPQVARWGQPALTLNLQLNPAMPDGATNVLTGTVGSGAQWQADLLAYRAIAAGSNAYGGAYTMLVGGCEDDGQCFGTLTNVPWGDSPAVAQVSPTTGTLQMSGSLADGSLVSQSTAVSENGLWPLYLPLYNGRGFLLGWISLDAPSPLLYWLMPPSVNRFYTNGFWQARVPLLTKYSVPPVRQNAVAWTNAEVVLIGGKAGSLTNAVVLSNNVVRVTGGSISNLSLTITPATGGFSGSFRHPVTRQVTPFRGVLDQTLPVTDAVNGGWFLGPDGSGGIIRLHPDPE